MYFLYLDVLAKPRIHDNSDHITAPTSYLFKCIKCIISILLWFIELHNLLVQIFHILGIRSICRYYLRRIVCVCGGGESIPADIGRTLDKWLEPIPADIGC